ncbi:hypothetical protein [Actinomadura sediminis]|uniref:Uncharacterized protein n=1 Tax=Actinomadura sediminis TaxID=1038904 RepID=A0ABW3EX48_9ACTN
MSGVPRDAGACREPEDDWSFSRPAASARDHLGGYAHRWEEALGTAFHTRAAFALGDGRARGPRRKMR